MKHIFCLYTTLPVILHCKMYRYTLQQGCLRGKLGHSRICHMLHIFLMTHVTHFFKVYNKLFYIIKTQLCTLYHLRRHIAQTARVHNSFCLTIKKRITLKQTRIRLEWFHGQISWFRMKSNLSSWLAEWMEFTKMSNYNCCFEISTNLFNFLHA